MILVVASLLPVVCLCGLTLSRLSATAHTRNEASKARETARNFIYMANTVQALQVDIISFTIVTATVAKQLGKMHSIVRTTDTTFNADSRNAPGI